MDCAIAYPDRVRTLTLLAPGLSGYDWPDDPDDERIMQAVADQDLDYITEFVLKTWAQGQGADQRTDAIVVEQARDSAKAWLTEDFEEPEPSAVDRLGEISQPTVLLVGDRDHNVIEDVAALVVARIPGARRVDAPGVDHFVPLRVPDLVSELVAEQVERAS
jgi:pimeloyl-ACP methyl ester carboxylesterase